MDVKIIDYEFVGVWWELQKTKSEWSKYGIYYRNDYQSQFIFTATNHYV